MFRTMRHFGAGTVVVMVMTSMMLVGCNPSSGGSPTNPAPVITAGPSPTGYLVPTNTPVPTTGPTLAESESVALSMLNAMPAQIGRFTLDKNPTDTYVAHSQQGTVVGLKVTYTISSGAQLVYAIWIGQDANYPLDRMIIEKKYLAAPFLPVEVGEEAYVSPTSKGRDDSLAFNPAWWGIVRFRNIGIDLDPTKTLTDQTSISQDEIVQLLQAAVNAIPK